MNAQEWVRSTSKITGEVLFIGVGKGGGAIVNSIQKLGYECFYINTAIGDFDNLENVDEDMVFPIPKAKGCNKNREKAFNFVAPYITDIHTHITQNYAKYKHFVFVFTTGGGTGSGSTPALAQYFAAQGKGTTLIGVLPSEDESKEALENALDCVAEVDERCGKISSILYLDNSCTDNVYNVNAQIAQQIDYLMCLSEYQVHTTLGYAKATDATENLEILSTPKYMGIARVSKQKPNPNRPVPKNLVLPYVIDSIESCAEFNTNYACKAMAISLACDENREQEFDPQQITTKFGKPVEDIKLGYNDTDETYVYLFGLEPEQQIVDRLQVWIDKKSKEVVVPEVKLEITKKEHKVEQVVTVDNPFAKKPLPTLGGIKPQAKSLFGNNPMTPTKKKPTTNPFTTDGKFKVKK